MVCACICFDEITGRRLPIRIQDQYTHVDATEQHPERLKQWHFVDVESSNGPVFLEPWRMTLLAVPVVVTGSLFTQTMESPALKISQGNLIEKRVFLRLINDLQDQQL